MVVTAAVQVSLVPLDLVLVLELVEPELQMAS
jgi:hypothetical protein